MTNNLTYTSLVISLACPLISSCDNNANSSIPEFVREKVIIASGINFKNKQLVAVNPLTGKEILPCHPISRPGNDKPSTNENEPKRSTEMKKNTQNCENQLNIDSNSSIASALELSKNPINGKVKLKNGEIVDAEYVVTVEAQFNAPESLASNNIPSSNTIISSAEAATSGKLICTTITVGGRQVEQCTTQGNSGVQD